MEDCRKDTQLLPPCVESDGADEGEMTPFPRFGTVGRWAMGDWRMADSTASWMPNYHSLGLPRTLP
jgi:hypothetical protein